MYANSELASGNQISRELLQNEMTQRQDKKSKLSDTDYREKLQFCDTCLLTEQGKRHIVVTLW